MTLHRSRVCMAAVAGALLALSTAAQAAPSYEVIDLGAGLTQTSSASGINSAGQVVGQVAGVAAIFEACQAPRTLESLLAGGSWAFDTALEAALRRASVAPALALALVWDDFVGNGSDWRPATPGDLIQRCSAVSSLGVAAVAQTV